MVQESNFPAPPLMSFLVSRAFINIHECQFPHFINNRACFKEAS